MITKRTWLVLVLLAALFVTASARADSRLTIAAYNVENMFDVFDDPYTGDEGTPVKPRAEIERIAAAIASLHADVVVFEELENEGILKAMVREMLPTAGYKYVASLPTNDKRGINLGVISRLPIMSLTSHRLRELTLPGDTRTWEFARDLAMVTIQVTPTRQVDVYVSHFKSKHSSENDPQSATWRLAEATMVWRIIGESLAKEPDRLIVLAGDLNDTPDSPPIQTLLGTPDGKPALLLDSHAALPAEKRVTYLRAPYRSTIDYLLASPAMHRCLVAGSARVLDDPKLLEGSDHAPIVATFDVGQ